MSAVTAIRRPSRQDISPKTPLAPITPYRKLTRALTRRKVGNAISATTIASDGGVDAFKSPLFHYASKTQLPLAPFPSQAASSSTRPDVGVRGRAATFGGAITAVAPHPFIRRPSEILQRETTPSKSPMLVSRVSSSRRRALSQPMPSPDILLRHKRSILTSTTRGAPKYNPEVCNDIIDMRSGTSSPAPSQGYPGRARNTVSPLDAVSPLYAVTFPNAALGRAEPRNMERLSPDRARSAMGRSKGVISTEISVKPISSRLANDDSKGRVTLTAVQRPTDRGMLEQQFDLLKMHSSGRLSGEEEVIQEDDRGRPKYERQDASESAEALLSLIRQNRGSDQSASTQFSSTGLPRSVTQTPSDSLLDGHESQESAAYSIASSLESFSLHTISHTLPNTFPAQRISQDTAQSNHLKQFRSAFKQYSTGPASQSLSDSIPSQSTSQINSPLQTRRREVRSNLEEADIETIEEEPIHTEQASLIGVRRKLVEEFEDLGRKARRSLTSKPSINNMGHLADSGSPRTEGSPRKWDFVSEKELRRREEDLETREKDLTIEALSKAEMAHVRIEIWTESRKGKWIIRGAAENDGYPPEDLPRMNDPWAIPIDSKGIVRRKKLKSNVELSSTRTVVDCPHCAEDRQLGVHVQCRTCDDSTRVEMVYSIQCVVRLAQFLPLRLPALLLLGAKQPHIKYIDCSDPGQAVDILRDRAINGLQTAAERVVKAHYAQHGSRLLMGRATITRRGLLSVSVTSSKTKMKRNFDVEDGANGKMVEVKTSSTRVSQSTSARSNVNLNLRKKSSVSPLNTSAKSDSSSLSSPPPFANLVSRKLKVDKPSSPNPPLLEALHTRPLPTPDHPPPLTGIKSKKSIRAMFYR